MHKRRARNLTNGIVENLGAAIVTGKYRVGRDFPTEAELCLQFDASRSVLREAVKMLTAKGLLSARPRQGTRVEPELQWNLLDPDVLRWLLERKFSLQLLTDFTEVRLAIEPMAAAVAARRRSPESMAAIHEAMDHMRRAEAGSEDPLAADIEFHVAVLRASGNRFFMELRDLIESALRTSLRLTHGSPSAPNVAEHGRVAQAIEAGHPQRARKAMESLLSEVMDLIIAAGKEGKPDSSRPRKRHGANRHDAGRSRG